MHFINVINKKHFLLCLQVGVQSWFDDMTDRELLDLIPFFEGLAKVDNVYTVLQTANRQFDTS